jgi:ABC-type transport system involved in multi-copper enzyme maturation permease subunit
MKDTIDKKMEFLKYTKKDIAQSLGAYSLFLVISLLLSITTLGMINSGSVYLNFLSVTGMSFFLLGIIGIVIGFIQISREP